MKLLRVAPLLLLTFPVYAALPNPGQTVTRAGVVTTYQILGTGPYNPPSTAPTGSGIVPLNATHSATSSAFVQNLGIPAGETIAAVRVSSPFNQAALAAGIVSLLRNPTLFNAALVAGSALYTYLSSQGLTSVAGDIQKSYVSGLAPAGAYNDALIRSYTPANQVTCCTTGTRSYYGAGWNGRDYAVSTTDGLTRVGYAFTQNGIENFGGCYSLTTAQNNASKPTSSTSISDLLAVNTITATPPSALVTPNIIKNLYDADITGQFLPITTTPTQTVPSPASIAQTPQTSVSPSGQVQTRTDSWDFTQNGTDKINATINTTVNTTNTDGTHTIITVPNAPPLPTESAKTDCDKYPKSAGCLELGTVPTPEILPTTNVSMNLSPISLGSGTCPAPQVLTLRGQPNITLSYQPYCDFASMSSPFIISLAWLSAGLIVLGAVKE